MLPKQVVPFDGLTPSTVDLHAYVFATSTNIADGRARGAIDGATDGVVYAFPGAFLDANRAVVYSTATTGTTSREEIDAPSSTSADELALAETLG